ncbi:glycogen synthase GlgA [Paenibacillus larvae]|nr:glycogen synthase GlgA [Paenibacillus larvae]MDT2260133.1 glycogen synthase GlgA [Paenibacillus larvae]
MKILFAAAEAVPFVKTGGLGDVIGSLPKELKRLGADIRVVLPKYGDIPERFRQNMETVAVFDVRLGWRNQYCGIEKLKHDEVTYYFVDNEYYFGRPGLYGYGDDAERFALFQQGVLNGLHHLDFRPDVIHCHDWQAGMIPVLLKAHYAHLPFYNPVKTVMTIHNLKYQGTFSKETMMDVCNLGDEYFTGTALEMHGGGSFLKGGLLFADWITTVSPTYAEEIQTGYIGECMDSLIRYRRDRLSGILNGIDYEEFNPAKDPFLQVTYQDSPEKKRQNKMFLQEQLGLPADDHKPMIGLVTRLVEQKGLDLIAGVLEELMSLDAQWVVLGTGDPKYEHLFRDTAERYPDRLSANLFFDEPLAHRIYAASDLFLMPSLFEPCGIGQMIAFRYHTIPIVRETGGLKDTVQPYKNHIGEGTGFTFANYNAHDMLHTVRHAIEICQAGGEPWNNLMNNVKKLDFSWRKSACSYIRLYEQLVKDEVLD